MTDSPVVHLVDDDESYLRATARMLTSEGHRTATFPSAARLLGALSAASRGCVVADLSMPEMDGLELQATLSAAGVHLPILFLSGHADIPSTVRAMQGGAMDFLEKHAPREQLVAAIRRALARDGIEHDARERLVALRRRFDGLSRRELEVLRLVAEGLSNAEIGARLFISTKTAGNHVSSILMKLSLRNRSQAAAFARTHLEERQVAE